MSSKGLNELKSRPFILVLIGTAIAIGLVGIHSLIINALWTVAGWPTSSSKYQNGVVLVIIGLVLGLIIISITIFGWILRRIYYKKNKSFVQILGALLIIMSICGIVFATYYGYTTLVNIVDFPEYGAYFIWRAFCLWAASISMLISIFGAIQIIRS